MFSYSVRESDVAMNFSSPHEDGDELHLQSLKRQLIGIDELCY